MPRPNTLIGLIQSCFRRFPRNILQRASMELKVNDNLEPSVGWSQFIIITLIDYLWSNNVLITAGCYSAAYHSGSDKGGVFPTR